MRTVSFYNRLKEHFRKDAFRQSCDKYIQYLRLKRLFADSLDMIGVFDGEFAYKGPNFAQIDLTNNCNNDCIGCWCNSPLLEEKKIKSEVKRQALPYRSVTCLLDELYAMGTTHIYYAGGGEPFMHPEIMEILAYTKKKGFKSYVNTNFTLVDEQRARDLIRLKVDHLTVSVWAGTASTYAAVHPNKDEETFNKIKDMLKFLNSHKNTYPVIKLYNVIFNMNYRDIEEMVGLALSTNSESIEFACLDTIPTKTDALLLNEQERLNLLKSCEKLKGNSRILNFEQFIRRIENSDAQSAEYDSDIVEKMPCYAGWAFVRILADGNVNSCLKSHRIPVGNIHKKKFSEIWNSSLQRYFREKTLQTKKTGKFFSFIGNDPSSSRGCYKSCDNIGHSIQIHAKIERLGRFKKHILKDTACIMKAVRAI